MSLISKSFNTVKTTISPIATTAKAIGQTIRATKGLARTPSAAMSHIYKRITNTLKGWARVEHPANGPAKKPGEPAASTPQNVTLAAEPTIFTPKAPENTRPDQKAELANAGWPQTQHSGDSGDAGSTDGALSNSSWGGEQDAQSADNPAISQKLSTKAVYQHLGSVSNFSWEHEHTVQRMTTTDVSQPIYSGTFVNTDLGSYHGFFWGNGQKETARVDNDLHAHARFSSTNPENTQTADIRDWNAHVRNNPEAFPDFSNIEQNDGPRQATITNVYTPPMQAVEGRTIRAEFNLGEAKFTPPTKPMTVKDELGSYSGFSWPKKEATPPAEASQPEAATADMSGS